MLCLTWGSLLLGSLAVAADLPEKVTYDDHIQAIFRERCLACHDQDGKSGDLALDSYAATIAGGASGEVVAGGAADDSRLYKLVNHSDKPIMPPDEDKLPDEQLVLIKAWIDGGLLENSGSKAIKRKSGGVADFTPSADNRPEGEPAMPSGLWREPVVHAPRAGAVAALAASPWAPLVAVAGQRQVLLYHSTSHELLGVVPFVVGSPNVIEFSRNGDLLLVAGGRGASLGVVDIWDVKTGRRVARIGDEVDAVLAADISPDHSLVALGGPRKRVKVFRTADNSLAYDFTKHTDWVTAMEFSPNGAHLVTADRGGNAYVWEAPTGRPVGNIAGHTGAIASVSWRGDSGVVATASDDGTVRLWPAAGGAAVKNWPAHGGGTQWVAFLKDGRIATAGRDRTAKLWNSDGGQISTLLTTSDLALSVVPTFDDKGLIVSDWAGQVYVVDATDPQQPKGVAQLSANPPTLAMRIEEAQGKLTALAPEVAPLETQLAAAAEQVAMAEKLRAEHEAKVKQAKDELTKREGVSQQQQATMQAHQQALAVADKAIEETRAQHQTSEQRVGDLQTELAALEGQQGEGANAERETKLRADLAAAEAERATAAYLMKSAEAGRAPLAKAVEAATQESSAAAAKVEAQRQQVAAIEAEGSQLPAMDKLVAERDRIDGELKAKRDTVAALEAQRAALEAELAAYRGAQEQLASEIAAHTASLEQLTSELTKLQEVHRGDTEVADKLAAEVKRIQQELAKIEAAQQQATEVAQASQAKADEVATQLDATTLKIEQGKATLEDLKAAQELQNELSAGN